MEDRLTLTPRIATTEEATPLDVLEVPSELPEPDRYDARGLIACGGMGEVWRVWDRRLERTLALKRMAPRLASSTASRARFRNESRITAGLNHLGVIAVYDAGEAPDGRLWYTMREVPGHRTLRAAMRAGFDSLGLLAALASVSEAMAYAHGHGVIHRDLKPDNVLIGDQGEVVVIDWGIARKLGAPAEAVEEWPHARSTVVGHRLGTPPYFAPEQARGEPDAHGPWSDVWALGALLWEILTGRALPANRALAGVGEPLPWPCEAPAALAHLAQQCLLSDWKLRPADATSVATQLRAWLVEEARRAQAEPLVGIARRLDAVRAKAQAEAGNWAQQAADRLEALGPFAPEVEKRQAWALQDASLERAHALALAEAESEQALRAALQILPGHLEARARLADLYADRLTGAEAARDAVAVTRAEAQLRTWDDGRYAAVLHGTGRFTLLTDPPGAELLLYRMVQEGRRLVPRLDRPIGRSPVMDLPVSAGSYLVEIRHPKAVPVWYPVALGRGEQWTGIRPGGVEPQPIPLPAPGDLGPDDRYVPPGWTWRGGDPLATDGLPRLRCWVDGFVIRRFAVCNAAYLRFLNALVDAGEIEAAQRYAPQEASGIAETPRSVFPLGTDGHYALGVDGDGVMWPADSPVVLVDWHGAMACAAWEARQTGQPWRLPHHAEREKAARGVDGRFFPWGDQPEPTWSCTGQSQPGPGRRVPGGSFPVDRSPYDVFDLSGNTRDWCLDAYQRHPGPDPLVRVIPAQPQDPGYRFISGGAWASTLDLCRSAGRLASRPAVRLTTAGIRLCRSWPLSSERSDSCTNAL